MIYRSNLTPPEMNGFALAGSPLQNCGHDIPSDPDFDPNCGFMSHDEIAILYATLHGPHLHKKTTVEIGARFGWTAKAIHQATSGCVLCVDPILVYGSPQQARFRENLGATYSSVIAMPYTAAQFFGMRRREDSTHYHAFVIDGDHDDPQPLLDSQGALSIANPDCLMIFHDGRGKPIQDAVRWLLTQGFRAKFYYTPAGMFVAWRGFDGWLPPDHDRDASIAWAGIEKELGDLK